MDNSKDAKDETRTRGTEGQPEITQRRPKERTEAAAAPPEEPTQRRDRPSTESLDPMAALGPGHHLTQRSAPITPITPIAVSRGAPLEPGACIRRRYVLERLIGSGGMGQVWKAKDLVSERARDPNPFVALKLLNADFEADPDAFVSLQRETKKAQELAHPNVITVYAFDTDDDGSGRAFMSMELLEGETLDRRINRHPAGVARSEASPLIVGMAKGLEYAHKKGIVHSDFKPGNVFLTKSDVPKVLDFGIARAAKIAGVDRMEDSFDAGKLGGLTMAYASSDMIEQHEPHPVDDVYALGLVAYELLTGSHPFRRLDATEARVKGMKPARIRSLRRYQWHAIARALEFDRRKRWQNAGEFLRAFEGKSVAALALGVLALILAIVAGSFWYQAQTAAGPSVPFEALSAADQAAFHQHMSDGDEEWRLFRQGTASEWQEAVNQYAQAYALHPRDPDATNALKKAADYMVDYVRQVSDPSIRLGMLKTLQAYSDFYTTYRPLTAAIRKARGSE